MHIVYDDLFQTLWIAWGVYWIVSSRGIKVPVRRESTLSRWAHYGPLIVAGGLLSNWSGLWPPLTISFMPRTTASFWVAAAITAAGLVFTVWARRHIGRNWSGSVTIKADHELITSGPYRLARHPIYAGLLIAFAGTALAVAQVRGLLAFAIAFAALWRKLKLEERYMRKHFGQAYVDYSGHVAAIVPFIL